MKTLHIMRHAHAPFNNIDDFERILSNEGHLQAQNAAFYLKENFEIDLILTSIAPRVLETSKYIEEEFDHADIIRDKTLYRASPSIIFKCLEKYKDYKNIILIGHNPEVLESAKNICCDGDLYKNQQHFQGMSPAKIISFNIKNDNSTKEQITNTENFYSSNIDKNGVLIDIKEFINPASK